MAFAQQSNDYIKNQIFIDNPLEPSEVLLNLTISPQISIPKTNERDYYINYENENFLETCNKWLKLFMNKKQNREKVIQLWGENIKKQSVFLPRFLRNLKPELDQKLLDEKNVYAWCARYVSLIPFKNDSGAFDGLPDMWCTCQQFLDLRAGDHEEHAILLCNYFNWLDFEKKNT